MGCPGRGMPHMFKHGNYSTDRTRNRYKRTPERSDPTSLYVIAHLRNSRRPPLNFATERQSPRITLTRVMVCQQSGRDVFCMPGLSTRI